jgi:hypothetical protein
MKKLKKQQPKIKINNKNMKISIEKLSKLLKSDEKITIEYSDKPLLRKMEKEILENFGERPLEYGIITFSKIKK